MPQKENKKLEGGTAHFWGNDIDSKEDEEWARRVRALLKKKKKI